MRAINASIMRHVNRTLILNNIRLRPISRAELAEETGLTRASVTQIVEELISEGIVIETSIIGRTRLGRRSTQLAINPRAGVIFGVNLGRGHCTVGVINMHGSVACQNTELVAGRSPEEVLDAVAATILRQQRELDLDPARIRGVGMCVPGPVDSLEGRILTPVDFPGWQGIPAAPMLSERTGLPVCLHSAADALALEEKYFGGREENFILVNIDDSVSMSVVVHGSLYRGSPDFPVDPGLCPVSVSGDLTVNDLISIPSLLGTSAHRSIEQLLASGDGLDPLVDRLSLGISCAIHAFGIPVVVLSGALAQSPVLLNRLNASVIRLCRFPLGGVPIHPCTPSNPIRMSAAPIYHTLFQTEFGSSCCRA